MAELIFLGTGGGRFATITQKRRTGGIRIIINNLHIHLDPGPGALIYSLQEKLNPQKLGAILVSHAHPDHYNDAEILIEAMTKGATKKRGYLIAPRSVLRGNEVCGPAISQYHQNLPKATYELKPGDEVDIENIKIYATKAEHTDPDTIGFRFSIPGTGDIAYTSDTNYYEEIAKYYRGVKLLILCVMRPAGQPWKGHMTTEDAIKILQDARPKNAVITHFGMKMIFRSPRAEAKVMERETGIPIIAAEDGMRIKIEEEIQVVRGRQAAGLTQYLQ